MAFIFKEVCLLARYLAVDVLMLHAYALQECVYRLVAYQWVDTSQYTKYSIESLRNEIPSPSVSFYLHVCNVSNKIIRTSSFAPRV
jgi:hypothetical protein